MQGTYVNSEMEGYRALSYDPNSFVPRRGGFTAYPGLFRSPH